MKRHRPSLSLLTRSTVSPTINLTPLVDVALVLLIVFMVLSTAVERGLVVGVPDAQRVDEVPLEQVLVQVDAGGALRCNGAPVERGDLVAWVRGQLAGRSSQDRVLVVEADDAAGYADVVSVVEAGYAGGATLVGLSGMTSAGEP